MRLLQFIFLAVATQCISGEADKGCAVSPLFYEELKCKAIYERASDRCAKAYDCSHMDSYTDDKCVLKGKVYNEGDKIPAEETKQNCKPNCRCTKGGKIVCAIMDCPMMKIRGDCYKQFDLNVCCSTKIACPPLNNSTCMADGTEYKEGQKFTNPNDRYSECVCKKTSEGKGVKPCCQKKSCAFEISHYLNIRRHCAPVFWNYNHECPIEFLCPSTDDDIVKADATSENSEIKCNWGSNLLNIGDKFKKIEIKEYETTETICECAVPPFVTCNRKKILLD